MKISISSIMMLLSVALTILIFSTSVYFIICPEASWNIQVHCSLYFHFDFQGHPWYNAPMTGKIVQLTNSSTFYVHSDYWDSCEHNPQQGHLIGIGYTNKTLYDLRVQLDKNVSNRNYTATFQTVIWVNASTVASVLP